MMPIGAYQPWIRAHCNPEQALKMANDIDATHFIPMHTMTFQQGNEPFFEPINWTKRSIRKYDLRLGIEEIGQTFSLKNAERLAELD
jgi:L-ascorbate metabolism protein UlaG (beta-lactamase superfamily)